MLHEYNTVAIAEKYVPALVNNDWSGLDPDEVSALTAWLEDLGEALANTPSGEVLTTEGESYFGVDNITGLRAQVVDVQILTWSD